MKKSEFLMKVVSLTGEPRVKNAAALAFDAHEGQTRKYSGIAYINHPFDVFLYVFEHPELFNFGGSFREEDKEKWIDCLCAALLHDVLEDCPQITEQQIIEATNERVLFLVKELTNPSKGSKAPRAVRKQMDRDHLKNVTYTSKLIKLVDRNVNLEDIASCPDKDFAILYADESQKLLECLQGPPGTALKELEDNLQEKINEILSQNWLNLKKLLMEFGNKLVIEKRFIPKADRLFDEKDHSMSTLYINEFTNWLNNNEAAREALSEMGINWPVVRE